MCPPALMIQCVAPGLLQPILRNLNPALSFNGPRGGEIGRSHPKSCLYMGIGENSLDVWASQVS